MKKVAKHSLDFENRLPWEQSLLRYLITRIRKNTHLLKEKIDD